MGGLLLFGLILMVVGFILTFIGIAAYESRVRDPSEPAWVYWLIIIGGSLVVIGAIITVFRFGQDSNNTT